MAVVELELPSSSAYVGLARLAAAALARRRGLDEGRIDDLKIAVSEACTNAVLSNESAGVEAPTLVRFEDVDDGLRVEVLDQGPAYDLTDLDPSDTQQMRLNWSHALLESLVDETTFSRREGGGMALTLVLRPGADSDRSI